MLRRRKRVRRPAPPKCPKCDRDSLVVLDMRETETGLAGHFFCPECSITTHAFTPWADRPTSGVMVW